MGNKLSMTKLDKLIHDTMHDQSSMLSYAVDGESIEIEVRHTISAEEMTELVLGVVSNLFVSLEDGDVLYRPERYDLSMAANVLSFYTNLKEDLGNKRLVSLVYETAVYEDVVGAISSGQYRRIKDAVERRVRFICDGIHCDQQSKSNELATKLDNAITAFEAFNQQLSGVSSEKVQSALNNIIRMTPDDFAGAVIRHNEGE